MFCWFYHPIVDESSLLHELGSRPPHKIDENMWKNREHIEESLYLLKRPHWPIVVIHIFLLPFRFVSLWNKFNNGDAKYLQLMIYWLSATGILLLEALTLSCWAYSMFVECSSNINWHLMTLNLLLFWDISEINFRRLWRFWSLSKLTILNLCSIQVDPQLISYCIASVRLLVHFS